MDQQKCKRKTKSELETVRFRYLIRSNKVVLDFGTLNPNNIVSFNYNNIIKNITMREQVNSNNT